MKRIILIVVLLAVLAGGWYAYTLYTGKVKSLTEVKTDVSVSATDLLAAFEKDSAAANKRFLGRIVAVNGTIKSVEAESATVVLGEEGNLSSVRCSMDTAFVKELSTLNPGNPIVVKGACTGYMADDLGIGADVVLNRCILEKNE